MKIMQKVFGLLFLTTACLGVHPKKTNAQIAQGISEVQKMLTSVDRASRELRNSLKGFKKQRIDDEAVAMMIDTDDDDTSTGPSGSDQSGSGSDHSDKPGSDHGDKFHSKLIRF